MVGTNHLIVCQAEMCRAVDAYLNALLTCGESPTVRCSAVVYDGQTGNFKLTLGRPGGAGLKGDPSVGNELYQTIHAMLLRHGDAKVLDAFVRGCEALADTEADTAKARSFRELAGQFAELKRGTPPEAS